MTTLEIILIIALVYSLIAHIVNCINVCTGGMICELEDFLLGGTLWPVAIICSIINAIIVHIDRKKKLDKSKS